MPPPIPVGLFGRFRIEFVLSATCVYEEARGRLAQLVAHHFDIVGATGSSPVPSIFIESMKAGLAPGLEPGEEWLCADDCKLRLDFRQLVFGQVIYVAAEIEASD